MAMTGEVILTYRSLKKIDFRVSVLTGEVPEELAELVGKNFDSDKYRRALAKVICIPEKEVNKWYSDLISAKGGEIKHPVKLKDAEKQSGKVYRLERDGKPVAAKTPAECLRKAVSLAGNTVTAVSNDFCFLTVTAADGSPLSAESLPICWTAWN